MNSLEENQLATLCLDISFKIHKMYGPGLFESVYEELLCYELAKTGVYFDRQHPVPLIHEEIKMEVGFRADIIIENKLLVELKSVELLQKIHFKQTLTYLTLTGMKLGLLINFNTVLLKDGILRIVNKRQSLHSLLR
jgi:GxxExxY protein